MTTLNEKALLTNKLFKKKGNKEKPYRIYDTDLKGFVARVLPSGKISYYYEYRNEAGKNKSLFIGRHGDITADQARDVAKNKAADKIKGLDVQAEKKKSQKEAKDNLSKTLEGFLESKYEKWATAHLVTADDILKRIKRNFPHLLNILMEEISVWDLEKWRTERITNGIKAATINRDINALKAALAKALEWGHIKFHPLHALKPIKIDSLAVTRYLTADETKQLLLALNAREDQKRAARIKHNKWLADRKREQLPLLDQEYVDYLKPMVIVSLFTGLRRGELTKLKWTDINLESGFLTAHGPNTKNKKTRHIPLHPEVIVVLDKWKEQASNTGFVFAHPDGKKFSDVDTSWGNIRKAANIDDVRWHDLRHDFASKLVMECVDLNTVRELLGHGDIRMTLRYAHLAPEHKSEAINKLKGMNGKPTVGENQ